jgi:hypothetical protein
MVALAGRLRFAVCPRPSAASGPLLTATRRATGDLIQAGIRPVAPGEDHWQSLFWLRVTHGPSRLLEGSDGDGLHFDKKLLACKVGTDGPTAREEHPPAQRVRGRPAAPARRRREPASVCETGAPTSMVIILNTGNHARPLLDGQRGGGGRSPPLSQRGCRPRSPMAPKATNATIA